MFEIEDGAHGYLEIDKDRYYYTIHKGTVTVFTCNVDILRIQEYLNRIQSINRLKYVSGQDSNGYHIVMAFDGSYKYIGGVNNINIIFAPLMIIKSVSNINLYEDWNKFNEITFYGYNINNIYDPEFIINEYNYRFRGDLLNESEKLRSLLNDSSYSIDTTIKNNKVRIKMFIECVSGIDKEENQCKYTTGYIYSCIKLSFDKAQSFDSIKDYYLIIKKLVAILSLQNNVRFESRLGQRNSDEVYNYTANIKIFDAYTEYSNRMNWHTIKLKDILMYLPGLIDVIESNQAEALINILPKDNVHNNIVSINDIKDMCTSMEVIYNLKNKEKDKVREKDKIIAELKKEIKSTIAKFSKTHAINVNEETNIGSAFKYIDLTLKNKIMTLYYENKDLVDSIVSKYDIPQITEKTVGEFVKLRNLATHAGKVEIKNESMIYLPLFVIVYAEILKKAGIEEGLVNNILENLEYL